MVQAQDTERPWEVLAGAEPRPSFRDPQGAVLLIDDRIVRVVNQAGLTDLSVFLASSVGGKWATRGALVSTSILADREKQSLLEDPRVSSLYAAAAGEAIVEHEKIPFASFPYEWAPEMLHAAGALTAELALDLLPESLGLKDATPYNVLFRGAQPVFVDVLSVERRDPHDPTWLPYAQFVRTFLLPLLANRYLRMPLDQIFFMRRDGLEPEEVYRWLKPWWRIKPPALALASIPVWLARRHKPDDDSIYKKKLLRDPEKARFILESLLQGLRRKIATLAPRPNRSSLWTGYMDSNNNYTAEHFAAKERFVQQFLSRYAPRRVLDVGCNTGHFSLMAARSGASVVALDYDPEVVGSVWRRASSENLDVLPLVVNLTRPTPALGWRNRECPSFLERAHGRFDAVFLLAVIHHMLVTERVPLPEIVDLAAELTTNYLVAEFVSPEDSMFRVLVRGRDELYNYFSASVFENSFRRKFVIVDTQHLPGTSRVLYLMQRL